MKAFDNITFNPKIMSGQACIRGMRITVSLVLSLVASGMTNEEILRQYPDLLLADIHECSRYAAWLAREETMVMVEK